MLTTSQTTPTTHRDTPATVLRWCRDDRSADRNPHTTILAALLTPGTEAAGVQLSLDDTMVEIQICMAAKEQALHLNTDLIMNNLA